MLSPCNCDVLNHISRLRLRDTVLDTLMHEIEVHQQFHLDTGLHGTYFLYKLLTDSSSGFEFGGSMEVAVRLTTILSHPGLVIIDWLMI